MAKLVIVESPAKAKTIGKYLGNDYEVTASMGHIRDLPASQLGIDVEHDYTPQYISIKGKEKLIKELKSKAKHADGVILATDPDREGEAISWHLANILGLDPHAPNRVTFDEITKKGVKEGMAHPRAIDEDLFNAQQARRVLDRLVGYKLSPFLWRKVRRGLSAGRVQSVAVRLIDDREKEIEAFKPEEYWNVDATLKGDYTMIQQGQSAVQFKTGMTADAKIAINGQDVTQAILGDTGVKLPLSLDVELRGDVTSGLFYVNMTGLSDLTGIPDQTWYKMDLKSMFDQMSDTTGMSYDTLMQLSAASADQGFQQALADILKNAPVTSVNGTTADTLRQLNDMLADSSFKKSGSDYVSTMTEDGATVKFTLNYSGNKVVGYAVDMKADMDDMGSMTMTVGMKDKTLNANMAFTVDDGEGSLVKLTMTMDGAYQATSQKPNTQPPAGAQIVDLLGDVEGR